MLSADLRAYVTRGKGRGGVTRTNEVLSAEKDGGATERQRQRKSLSFVCFSRRRRLFRGKILKNRGIFRGKKSKKMGVSHALEVVEPCQTITVNVVLPLGNP